MTSFVLLNQCTDAALTTGLLAEIANALAIYLDRDVSSWWGGDYRVRAATQDNPPAPAEVVCLIVDDLPDAPGAVAFHNWQGTPQVYAARNMCQSLTSGQWSLSQALAHELAEVVGDLGCNLWADDGTGTEWAHELCDPVEGTAYDVEGIAMSDFVLPAYFNVGSLGPYSFVQSKGGAGPDNAFGLSLGGYAMKRTASTDESQVQAMAVTVSLTLPLGTRAVKKAHWSSRTFRRGARV